MEGRVQTYDITEYIIKETSVGVWELSINKYNSHYWSHGFGSKPNPRFEDTLYYVEPQEALPDVSALAGKYEPEGAGVASPNAGGVFEIDVFESGSVTIYYGDTKSPSKFDYPFGTPGGSSYSASDGTDYNVLIFGRYRLLPVIEGGVVVGATVQHIDNLGIFAYERTGEAPKEIPAVIPVDPYTYYAGQYLYYIHYNSPS